MDTSQYMSMFLEESMDNLQTLNESLLELEQDPTNVDKLNEIFRVAHTIKGMAATMGFSDMAELTHKMEDVLSKFRNGEMTVTAHVVTTLFKCLDTLELMVDNISEENDEKVDVSDIIQRLQDIQNQSADVIEEPKEEPYECKPCVEEETRNLRCELNEYDINIIKQAEDKGFMSYDVDINLDENTILKSARAFLVFRVVEELGEVIKSMPSTDDIENENFDYNINIIIVSRNTKEEIQQAIMGVSEIKSVDVVEIKCNENKISENTIQHAEIETQVLKEEVKAKIPDNKETVKRQNTDSSHKKSHQSVRVDLERLDKFLTMVSELVIHRTRLEQIASNEKVTEFNETLEQIGRTTTDLQELVMKIRMLPLETVFNRFPRMIRDLSVELGKDMELIIEGQDTELDRTVIDEIGEPLIHLLRNSADHGIEDKETRLKAGKPAVGQIRLIAYQEGTKAVIKVEDDGAGINVARVKAKAEEKGINTEGLNDDQLKNLIFDQGFSTNEKVTDISGRGVGMDVVMTKITSLGGTVDLVSEQGKGSTFTIKLPLTLQIIKALLVRIENETMAISLGYIDRVLDFTDNMVKKTNGKEVILYSGNVIPLIRINRKLNLPEVESKKYVVIAKVGDKTVGLLVDSLLGQREIVIKPFGKTLQSLKEYIGATILGDGLVTLILDVASLI
ncbi:two-component system, chemotaxis family, sensor kinase CheA [Hathewaya proteolytica DSM 3090]|uniref:Chemotaxis protein CheA n=1 Tax=Hathewaya proteolytica DSM 3090 TaxID=1121331 RepID=A0A1M6LCK5_9CLOT|nr:chemotaxis protein CheA [Hathewaya proteolytica]SHJ68894.1 two-component system, chemotaxis family, sensor kinase CheA [Hathewaya proteolytica DSM 3090]